MTRHEKSLSLMLLNRKVVIPSTACVMERFVRNPCCFGYKMLCFSEKDVSLVFINFSNILDKQGNTEFGR